MRSSESPSLQTVPVEIMVNISIPLMECVRTVSIVYPNCAVLSLNTAIPHPYSMMPPYSQRGQVILTGMTLQASTYPTLPHPHFYS